MLPFPTAALLSLVALAPGQVLRVCTCECSRNVIHAFTSDTFSRYHANHAFHAVHVTRNAHQSFWKTIATQNKYKFSSRPKQCLVLQQRILT